MDNTNLDMSVSDYFAKLTNAVTSSPLVRQAAVLCRVEDRLFDPRLLRPLEDGEIVQLEAQRNWARDWSLVTVHQDFRVDAIRNNRFVGKIILGTFSGAERDLGDGVRMTSGIFDSTLGDVVVGDEATVDRVGLLRQTVVASGAAVVNCSTITCEGPTHYGSGTVLPLGVQTGHRQLRSFPELDVELAHRLTVGPWRGKLLHHYDALLDEYLEKIEGEWNLIGTEAIVIDTRRVENCWIGPSSVVRNATLLSSSTLLSHAKEECRISDGTLVHNSIVQWGAKVASSALIDSSVLCDHCRVERQAKVSGSLIGPNAIIGQGEVTSSLIGPFVGFQHQALLIAALWPGGKGNVGHGANIGSNHTGRAPDQEIRCGEGIFFGLGVNIKFPADFTRSPYSILATAVVSPPQKIEFPFSLINTPTDELVGVPRWFNEIFPGWVLMHNAYTVKRSEGKFRQRDNSRGTRVAYDLIYPELIDLMVESRDRLANVTGREYYTNDHIDGLGKNYLTEKSRLAAIDSYDLWIDDYCLRGLKDRLVQCGVVENNLWDETTNDERWGHARGLLLSRRGIRSVRHLLDDLLDGARRIAECVEISRAKDWSRGIRIISDYEEIHGDVSQDSVVRRTWADFRALEGEVGQLFTP